MLHQHIGHQVENAMKRAHYVYCGVVKDISDFRELKASCQLDLATDEVVARYHPEGKNRPIRKITDLFSLFTDAKRKAVEKVNGKKLFIYRRV